MSRDISPELLEKIQKEFGVGVRKSKKVSSIYRKVQKGTASYSDCQTFSKELGAILGRVFKGNFTDSALPNGKLYYNILQSVVTPMIGNNHEMIMQLSSRVAKAIDAKDGLGLNSVTPLLDRERVEGIYNDVLAGSDLQDSVNRLARDTGNVTESFFDDFVKSNADFRFQSGMNPQVIRILVGSKPCKWCQSLAGIYDYEEVSNTGNDVWKRHLDCHCQIIYKNNRGKYLEGVRSGRRISKEQDLTAQNILNLDEKEPLRHDNVINLDSPTAKKDYERISKEIDRRREEQQKARSKK